jgi:hypothetical protein
MQDWSEALTRFRSLQLEILRAWPYRDVSTVPNPRAAEGAIVAAERLLGIPLPPSYRAFLKRHDGWTRFFDGVALFGTATLGNRDYETFARVAFEAAETPTSELTPIGRKRRTWIPFGADMQATTLFAFNPDVVRADGEYEVVAWINEIGIRRDSFGAFLEALAELYDADLAAAAASSADPDSLRTAV